MILWDSNTRRKDDKKKKKKREIILKQIQEEDRKQNRILLNFYDFEEGENLVFESFKTPWHVKEEFVPFEFISDSSSNEPEELTINEIFADLFSVKRIKRKVFLAARTVKKVLKIKSKEKKTEEVQESVVGGKKKITKVKRIDLPSQTPQNEETKNE